MTPYLLLISNHAGDQKFAEVVARVTGFRLVHCRSLELGLASVGTLENIGAIFVDAANDKAFLKFQDGLLRNERITMAKLKPSSLHYISEDPIDELPFLAHSPFFGNLLDRKNMLHAEAAAQQYAQMVLAGRQAALPELRQLLGKGAKVEKATLLTSEHQKKISEEVKKVELMLGSSPRLATKAALAAEEILMNAIFDSPVDEKGERLYQKLSRTEKLTLQGKGRVEFEVGFDSTHLGMRITDHYGSLEKAKLMAHIARTTTGATAILDEEHAGAGLGLATVYRTNASLLFRTEPGVRTDVYLFFPKVANVRELKSQFRFFSTDFR